MPTTTDQGGDRTYSLTARSMLILVAGLLVLEGGLFFAILRFRAADQFHATALDRARVASSLYTTFQALPRPEREKLAARLHDYKSFTLRLADRPPFPPGDSARSLSFASRLENLVERNAPAGGWTNGSPRVVARVNHYAMHWNVFSFARTAYTPGDTNNTAFDAEAAVELEPGQWLVFDFRYFALADNNLLGLLIELTLMFLLHLALAVGVIRYVTRPLRQLAEFADKLVPHVPEELPEGLPLRGPSEVVRTSRAFAALHERLRLFLRERVKMLAGISHDLRTPVHRIRLYLESDDPLAYQDQLLEALDDLQTMADNAVAFARTGVNAEQPRVADLTALLRSAVDDFTEYLILKNVEGAEERLRFHAGPPVRCLLRPATFRRCVENILDNAVRYGQRADVWLDDLGHTARVRVCDRGPGVPDEALEDIFLPFFRLQTARSRRSGGNGLGLSIARDMAALDHAALSARPGPEGGLEIRIDIPKIP